MSSEICCRSRSRFSFVDDFTFHKFLAFFLARSSLWDYKSALRGRRPPQRQEVVNERLGRSVGQNPNKTIEEKANSAFG